MKSIKKLWNSIIKSIEIRDNQSFIDEIFELENNIKKLNERNGELVQSALDLTDTRIKLEAEIIAYQTEVDFLNTKLADKSLVLTPYNKSYQGHLCRKWLAYDREYILNWAKKLLTRKSFSKRDDLVYHWLIQFYKITKGTYQKDVDKTGLLENWDYADAIIRYFEANKHKKFDDCDGFSHVIFACLYELILDFFPKTDMSCLKCFIVDAYPMFGHALVGYKKETMNDFMVIETSYFNNNFSMCWKNEYTFKNNMLYHTVKWAYDKESEYKVDI